MDIYALINTRVFIFQSSGGGDEMKIDAIKATVPETSLSKGN